MADPAAGLHDQVGQLGHPPAPVGGLGDHGEQLVLPQADPVRRQGLLHRQRHQVRPAQDRTPGALLVVVEPAHLTGGVVVLGHRPPPRAVGPPPPHGR
ncbi:hypothetical protein [Ornithinimicrobium kibberense]|uniref:hypothetical protein n=1 Tax=Ornithinimicrobium kibberense TaxID=282060 RepID=UPI00361F059E